jgi:ribonuclease PH
MNKLFEFLGLKNITIEKTMLNQSASKTYYSTRFLELTQSPLLQGLKKIIPNKIITAIKDSRVMEYVSKKKIDVDIDVITAENRLLLKFFLSDDLKKFENLTKIKFVE